ncbi:MAG: hypothetical protein AVDCRST_MAG29-1956 [uncultured Nocardioidaceae bacterium]|uniref:STAS domain-containing protein n=1 Tax=uncultured Nocardioidaceae bacterium TaxID=253824 RepID=A0A6J4M1W5_9ACTN|nr:MAG: hypothetical protein AVDCRST_MAG29-1956 [uncultured Nocardioidaceae bacterium]
MWTSPLADPGVDPILVQPLRPRGTRGWSLDGQADDIGDGLTRAGRADVTITIERSSTGCLVRVAGELDGNTCSLLDAIFEHIGADTSDDRIELDLSDVSFADCEGLLPALRSNTTITTASPAVSSTLRSLASGAAAPP